MANKKLATTIFSIILVVAISLCSVIILQTRISTKRTDLIDKRQLKGDVSYGYSYWN